MWHFFVRFELSRTFPCSFLVQIITWLIPLKPCLRLNLLKDAMQTFGKVSGQKFISDRKYDQYIYYNIFSMWIETMMAHFRSAQLKYIWISWSSIWHLWRIKCESQTLASQLLQRCRKKSITECTTEQTIKTKSSPPMLHRPAQLVSVVRSL